MKQKKEQLDRKNSLSPFLMGLIGVAIFFCLIGVFSIWFIQYPENMNATMIAGWFSLSSVLFFVTALIYQIKEYKLQRVEFAESIKAQNFSARALEEQRQIMLEQKTDAFLMGIIHGFNEYKVNENIHKHIVLFNVNLKSVNATPGVTILTRNNELQYQQLATDLIRYANSTIKKERTLQRFITFFWNMVLKIEESKQHFGDKENYFYLSYFFNQLSQHEVNILILSEILEMGNRNGQPYLKNANDIQSLVDFLEQHFDFLRETNSGLKLLDAINADRSLPF